MPTAAQGRCIRAAALSSAVGCCVFSLAHGSTENQAKSTSFRAREPRVDRPHPQATIPLALTTTCCRCGRTVDVRIGRSALATVRTTPASTNFWVAPNNRHELLLANCTKIESATFPSGRRSSLQLFEVLSLSPRSTNPRFSYLRTWERDSQRVLKLLVGPPIPAP